MKTVIREAFGEPPFFALVFALENRQISFPEALWRESAFVVGSIESKFTESFLSINIYPKVSNIL